MDWPSLCAPSLCASHCHPERGEGSGRISQSSHVLRFAQDDRCRTSLTLTALCLVLLATGCSTIGKSVPGINNFDEVRKDVLYRGAQPSEKGIKTLADRGVRTVVNLRADPLAWEKDAVIQSGMEYVWIPSLAERNDPKVIEKFLATMRERNRPVFVHCRVGRDRTGLNVAAWRIVHEKWSRDEAIHELYAHGYNWMWFPNIERYLRSFDPKTFPTDPGASPYLAGN